MATRPRHVRPGGVYFITRRVTQQQFLLRPDAITTQNLTYALGCALAAHDVELHSVTVMSNHVHLIATDPSGHAVSDFAQYFFSLVARSMNVLRKRTENFWNSQKTSIIEVAPMLKDLAGKISYVVSNPVAAHLVSHSKHWPGLILLPDQIGKKRFTAKRPTFFYRQGKRATLPDEVSFTSSLPKCFDASPAELLDEIQERVRSGEQEIRDEVRAQDSCFLGVTRAKTIDVEARPEERAPWRNSIPVMACRDKELRKKMAREYLGFLTAYRRSLRRYHGGDGDVEFPPGTQKMVWFHCCNEKPHGPRPWESQAS